MSSLQSRVFALVTDDRSANWPLRDLVAILEEQGGDELRAAVILFSSGGSSVEFHAGPRMPLPYLTAVKAAVPEAEITTSTVSVDQIEEVEVVDIVNGPNWAMFRDVTGRHGLTACWAVAIRGTGDILLGAVVLYCETERQPTGKELRLASLAASAAGLIVDRDRTRAALQQQTFQLRALAEAAPFIARAPSLKAALCEVGKAARHILGVRLCGVMTERRGVNDTVEFLFEGDASERQRFEGFARHFRGIITEAAEDRVVRLSHTDLQASEAWKTYEGDTAAFKGWLATPLRARDGALLGFIQLSGKVNGSEFDDQDEGLVTQLALLGSAALEQTIIYEELQESEARYEAITNSIDQMIWATRPDGYHDFYNARWYEYTGVPAGSTDGEEWNGMFHPDDRERAWATWRRSLETGERYHIEYRLRHHSGEYRWVIGRAQPVRDANGQIVRWFGTCTDIHDLKAAEEQRELVSRELSHRIKNIFAVVGSIVALSARAFPEARSYVNTVRARLNALAAAHEYVRPHSAESGPPEANTTIHGLLFALLNPYDNSAGARFIIRGCDASIGPQAATGLALVIHELATNAVKYGALVLDEGQVEITCQESQGTMEFLWEERGGPTIAAEPERVGFGSSLAERVAMANFGTRIEREWRNEGLAVSFVAPLDALAR